MDDLERAAHDALDDSNAVMNSKSYEWATGWGGWNLYMRQVRMAEKLKAYRLARLALRRAVRGLRRLARQSAE